MAHVLEIKGYSSEEIQLLIDEEKDHKIRLKLCAIYQVSCGKSSRKLEAFYQRSFKQIINWVHRFIKEGVAGLEEVSGRGRKCKLSIEQLAILKETLLNKSPEDFGYNTSTWNGILVIEWIKNNFVIEYKKAQIYVILKKLGLSYQKGKGFYPEASEIKQEEFKEGLKKSS